MPGYVLLLILIQMEAIYLTGRHTKIPAADVESPLQRKPLLVRCLADDPSRRSPSFSAIGSTVESADQAAWSVCHALAACRERGGPSARKCEPSGGRDDQTRFDGWCSRHQRTACVGPRCSTVAIRRRQDRAPGAAGEPAAETAHGTSG